MKTRLFVLPLLALAFCAASAKAQPTYKTTAPLDYQAPKADLEKWAERLKLLCPKRGWTVSVQENDVVIERDQPVLFKVSYDGPQPSPFQRLRRIEKKYRLRLRFAPALTLDKYDELLAQNMATVIERQKLLGKYGAYLVWGFTGDVEIGGFGNSGQEQMYLAEAKNLIFTRLPDFYAPDYSITVFQSWNRHTERIYSDDVNIDDECNEVRASLLRTFGVYDSEVAKGFRAFGLDEGIVQRVMQ